MAEDDLKSDEQKSQSDQDGGVDELAEGAQKIAEDYAGWAGIINLAVVTLGWSEIGRALSRSICTIVPSVSQFASQFGGGKFKLWVKPLSLSTLDIAQMIIWILITAVWAIIILAIIALIAAAVICLSGPVNAAECVYDVVTS